MNVKSLIEMDLDTFAAIIVHSTKIYIIDRKGRIV